MLLQELRLAGRTARAHPGFTAVVVLTLALGLAANAVMFGIIDHLLLSPPTGVHDAGRITRLYFTNDYHTFGRQTSSTTNYPTYIAMRDQVPAFDQVAAYQSTELLIGEGVDAHPGHVQLVTASFFPVLGAHPALGRFFTPDEDRVHAAAPVAVLSDALWRGVYGGDRNVLGRTIVVNAAPYTIIGVAQPGFAGADLSAVDVWVPLSAVAGTAFGKTWDTNDDSYWLQTIAHLRAGATRAVAAREATVAYRRLDLAHPKSYTTSVGVLTGPLNIARGPDQEGSRWWRPEVPISLYLLAVSFIVLLIACANVANLLLARAIQRRQEIAIRMALGIGRARLIVHLLAEGLVLAVFGGTIGLLLAYSGGRVVRAMLLPDVTWNGSPVNMRVLVSTAIAALLAGVLAALIPTLRASRPDLTRALKADARGGGSRHTRARTTLLIVQAALSVVLLAGAGLFVRSLRNVRSVDLGMQASRLIVAYADFTQGRVPARELDVLVRMARDRLAHHHPGIEGVSIAAVAPFTGAMGDGVRIPGRDSLPRVATGGPYANTVSTDFFHTIGSRILRGRDFVPADAGRPVVIINAALARTYWPGQNPVGTCIYLDSNTGCSTIVGIVEDIHQWQLVREQAFLQTYTPLAAVTDTGIGWAQMLVIRTAGDPHAMAADIHHELAALSPELAYLTVQPMDARFARQLHPWQLGATMFSVFGTLALLIAAVGLYCVLAYTVAQRVHEIGVRMALGARAPSIVRLVVWSGVRTVLLGVAIGLGVVIAAGRAIASVLYDVSPRDPLILGIVAATFALVALAASVLPAWRAARVDPAVALRNSE